MEETNTTNAPSTGCVTLMVLFGTLWARRRVFYWVLPITFVIASALILSVPRYYSCEVQLAPETTSVGSSSSLMALASTFGFDINSMTKPDALNPDLYPDIVQSQNFLISLFDVPVRTADGAFSGTLYEYMNTEYKLVFWKRWKSKVRSLISPKSKTPVVETLPDRAATDVFYLSRSQWDVIHLMQDNIVCENDLKTRIVTFKVTMQDMLVAAAVADSVCSALQAFIIEYRTVKNRKDIQYYEQVMGTAYDEYKQASNQYVRYMDSHRDMKLEQYRIEAQNLENEMQLKYQAYSAFQKQYMAAHARLQENTPAFTVIKSASIPLKPAGPRRVMFVLAMLIFVTGVTCCIVCRKQLMQMFVENIEE